MKLMRNYNLTELQISRCKTFFSVIHEGDYIYPGSLKSKIFIDVKTAYLIMEELKKQGYVKTIYEVYCRECDKSKGIYFDTINDFNNESACDFCNKDLSPLDDIIVLYKVIHL